MTISFKKLLNQKALAQTLIDRAEQREPTPEEQATITSKTPPLADKEKASKTPPLADKEKATVAKQIVIFINAHLLVIFYVPIAVCLLYGALYYFWPEISAGIIDLNHYQLQKCKHVLQNNKFDLVEEYINCVQKLKNFSNSPASLVPKHINCQLLLNKINSN